METKTYKIFVNRETSEAVLVSNLGVNLFKVEFEDGKAIALTAFDLLFNYYNTALEV